MKARHNLLILAGIGAVMLLAFLLQDVIRQVVVTPIAYLWWVLKIAYAALPQLVLWIIFLAILIFSVITNLVNWLPARRRYAEAHYKNQGPVEILAGWLKNKGEGNYYRWMIANRLGKLWYAISGGETRPRARSAPPGVQRYLQAGLDESFVDYPLPALPFIRRKATPFDLDVEQAVEFLEAQLEAQSGKRHG